MDFWGALFLPKWVLDDKLPKVDDIITIPADIIGKVDDISLVLDDIRIQPADEVGKNATSRLRESGSAKKETQNQTFIIKNT